MPWQLDRGRPAGEMGYLPGLDGLRAVAVLGVLLYHADVPWLPGGYLGVDVFFVLSGFLITSLILEELDRSGRLDFGRFYLGRARRLLPALILVLLVVTIAVVFVYKDAASQFRTDALASLFYVNNWWYVIQQQSYFEFIGRPPLLQHLWSLAVEEQFYLIWPAIAFLVYRWGKRRGVALVSLLLAIASTAWMVVLSRHNGVPDLADPSRAYFGTDAHCMGLLMGAALATLWRPGRLRAPLARSGSIIVTVVGAASFLGVLYFFFFVSEFTPFMYTQGGFLILAAVTVVLIAMATHPGAPLGGWIGSQPWRWIGQRSYGLYLWHWPIFMVTRPLLDWPLDGPIVLALRLALTFGIAELSYRYVEIPIRRGALMRVWRHWRTSTGAMHARFTGFLATIGTFIVASLLALVIALVALPAPGSAAGLAPDVAEAKGINDGGPTEVTIDATPSPSASTQQTGQPSPSATPVDNGPATLFGDSVMLGARNALYEAIPGAKVDAAVSRYPGAFTGRIIKTKKRSLLADIVVIHAGTNGVMPESILRAMLDQLTDRKRVVVVNTAVPRPWRGPDNAVIDAVTPDYPNVVVLDWNSAAKGHPEWFVSDGVHLTSAGAKAYADMIKQATGL
jgi:peptidoglycan/LPS O-acetylase OafA/YrhL